MKQTEKVLRDAEWKRFCRLCEEARKNFWAVIRRLWRQGEDDLAEDVFDAVVQ